MEEIVLRFPVIAQQIFEQLDNQDLIKFREVDKSFCSSIDQNRLIWTRMIKKYIKDNNKFRKSWKLVMEKVTVKTLEDLALTTTKFGIEYEEKIEYHSGMLEAGEQRRRTFPQILHPPCLFAPENCAPQHIVAKCGNLTLYKFITDKTGEINPMYVIQTFFYVDKKCTGLLL